MEEKRNVVGVRNLDVTTSSMDLVQLNNLVVSMRPLVKKCKVYIIRHLVQQIHTLRSKKGTEEQLAANQRKVDKLVKEIDTLKRLCPDRISKYSLANTSTLNDLGKENDAENRVLLRLACHKVMSERVKQWRDGHSDWEALAAFLLYKNTGKRFKKKKRNKTNKSPVKSERAESVKQEISTRNEICEENRHDLSEEVIEPGDIHQKSVHDINEKTSRKQRDTEQKNFDRNEKCDDNARSVVTGEGRLHKSNSDLCVNSTPRKTKDNEQKETLRKHSKLTDEEAVIKTFNLGNIDDDVEDLDFLFGRPAYAENEDSSSDKEDHHVEVKRRDHFFCDSSGSNVESDDAEHNESGSQSDISNEGNHYSDMCYESTFLETLAADSKPRAWSQNYHVSQYHNRECGLGNSVKYSRSGNIRKGGVYRKSTELRSGYKHNQSHFSNVGEFTKYTGQKPQNSNQLKQQIHGSRKDKRHSGDKNLPNQHQSVKKRPPEAVQSLHPSWEASKKRKLEQSQINVFQGKKITFDD